MGDLDDTILRDILNETRETSKAIGGLTSSVDTIKLDTQLLHQRITDAKALSQANATQIDQHRGTIQSHGIRLDNIDSLKIKVVMGVIAVACAGGGGAAGVMKIVEVLTGTK